MAKIRGGDAKLSSCELKTKRALLTFLTAGLERRACRRTFPA